MVIHKIENGIVVDINGKPVNEAPKAKAKKEIKAVEVPNEEIKVEDDIVGDEVEK